MKKKRKQTIGQRTFKAIMNCETYQSYKRLCRIGSMVVPNYKTLADAFVDEYIRCYEGHGTQKDMDKVTNALGRAIDNAWWDWFWKLAYKIALRRRRA